MKPSSARPIHPKLTGSQWLKCPYPRTAPRMRLVCFPHAGGTASVYHRWGQLFSPDIEVWAVELPGHGSRVGEPVEQRLDCVASAIVGELDTLGLPSEPFAFFGHSMGGLLSFEVARAFRHSPMLKHLFTSGCHAPQQSFDDPPIHALPPDDFLTEMSQRYGGIPQEILREKDLLALILPVLRADMKMIECHRYQPENPLGCPITSFAGRDDARATQEVIGAWRAQTTADFEMRYFSGGHFYLQSEVRELVAAVESKLLNGAHR